MGNRPYARMWSSQTAFSRQSWNPTPRSGVSYTLSDTSDIHFAYEHAFGKTMTDSGKGDLFSFVGKGTKIHLAENTFTVQYSYKF